MILFHFIVCYTNVHTNVHTNFILNYIIKEIIRDLKNWKPFYEINASIYI